MGWLKERLTIKNILCVLAFTAACTVVFMYNPSQVQWMPKCVFFTLTGYKCPTCGATRAAHALMHGRLTDAFMLNPLMPVLFGLAVVIIYRYLFLKKESIRLTNALLYCYLGVYITWWIVRNILNI